MIRTFFERLSTSAKSLQFNAMVDLSRALSGIYFNMLKIREKSFACPAPVQYSDKASAVQELNPPQVVQYW